MKILIVYAGKTGTTEKCANLLAKKLDNVTIVNLLEQNPNVNDYDVIIVGSNIRFGKIHKKVSKFLHKWYSELLLKNAAYFVCCAFVDKAEDHFKINFQDVILSTAVTYDTFGGEMDLSKQKGFDKFIVKMVSKTKDGQKEVKILEDRIESFAREVKKVKIWKKS